MLESAFEGEITDHVGYDQYDVAGRASGSSRNGTRAETVLTEVGPVEVRVPRMWLAPSSRESSASGSCV